MCVGKENLTRNQIAAAKTFYHSVVGETADNVLLTGTLTPGKAVTSAYYHDCDGRQGLSESRLLGGAIQKDLRTRLH